METLKKIISPHLLYITGLILYVSLLSLALSFLFSSCDSDPEIEPVLENSRVTIINDEEVLNARVIEREDTIPLNETGINNRKTRTWFFWMILSNEIPSPEINGKTLQATSVDLNNNSVVVGYNFAGSTALGAVETYILNRNAKMKSQIKFNDADINDLFVYDDKAYLATGSTNSIDGITAIAEVYPLKGFKFDLDGHQRIPLGSYVANSVYVSENDILITTGDDETKGGGIYQIDRINIRQKNYQSLHDARWVEMTGNEVFIMQGTPGQYSRLDQSLAITEQVPVAGADIPESKSTMEIHGNMAFLAAGSAGVQIYNILTNEKIGEIPLPESKKNQITLTNAVSYDDGLLFISNGEGGIWVAEVLTSILADVDHVKIDLLGYMEFKDLPSVNHVAFKNNYLIIAAGEGGVKVVRIIRFGF